MDSQKVGILISKMRKNKNLTQQELANQLGVSPKTISKWETGNGLPDISILKKLSKIFDITIEELLDGNLNKGEKTNYKKRKYIVVLIIFILFYLFACIFRKQNNNINDINNCTVIRTYYIDNIGKSNDDNYLYITVHEYQVEGTYTLKLPKIVSSNLEVGNSYEFTLKTNKNYIFASTDILFKNTEIIKIEYSDKVGLDMVNTYNCE